MNNDDPGGAVYPRVQDGAVAAEAVQVLLDALGDHL